MSSLRQRTIIGSAQPTNHNDAVWQHQKTSSRQPLFSVSFRIISLLTLALPLTAFAFCIIYSFFYHFEWTTHTHCNVWNFAPSISAAIGLFRPQKYVWKTLLALHSAPRLLLATMYRSYFKEGVSTKFTILVELAYTLNVLENLSLLLLSFAPSREDFRLHKACFTCFLVCSAGYMILTYWLLSSKWTKPRNPWENVGQRLKRNLLTANATCIVVALYLYYRHNKYCEPGMYSIFSLFEYGVVMTNMGYHCTSYYDFYDRALTV